MVSKFLDSIFEKYGARSPGEKRFIDLHKIKIQDDPNKNGPDIFSGAKQHVKYRLADKVNKIDSSGKDKTPDSMNDVYDEQQDLGETLTNKTGIPKIIDDFVHSTNKKFKDDNTHQRIKRALGAYYSMHEETDHKVGSNGQHSILCNSVGEYKKWCNEMKRVGHTLHDHHTDEGPLIQTTFRDKDKPDMVHIVGLNHSQIKEQCEVDFEDGSKIVIESELAVNIADIYHNLNEQNQQKFSKMLFTSQDTFEKALQFVEKQVIE